MTPKLVRGGVAPTSKKMLDKRTEWLLFTDPLPGVGAPDMRHDQVEGLFLISAFHALPLLWQHHLR